MRSLPWRPVPYGSLHKHPFGPRLAQAAPVPGAPKGSESFLESPLLALGTDVVGVALTGYLSWGLAKRDPSTREPYNKPMSVFWLVMATVLGMKALHDASRLNA